MQKIKKGYYRHFKGGIAKVIGEAKHSETGEDFVAYYHKEKQSGEMVLWVRPKEMFLGEVVYKGKRVARFEYIGTQIEANDDFT